MKRLNLGYIQLIQFDRYERYKVVVSVLFGLLGFIGTFYSIQFNYDTGKLFVNWSLIFPLLIALVWGKRYGCLSIILGLTVLYPFYPGRYNGWACLVPAFSLYIWVMLIGYGTEKRLQIKKFYTNIYFLQFIYIIIRLILYFTAFPFLFRLNPPFWYHDAHTSIEYSTIAVFAFKSVIVEFALLAVSDTLLILPFVRKIFRLKCSKASRYNTRIVLCIVAIGIFSAIVIMITNNYIINVQHSMKWLMRPSIEILMNYFLTIIFCLIFGGVLARTFQWFLESEDTLKVSEEKYRSIYENINDLYAEVALDGKILTMSPSVKRILGYDADDLIGTNMRDLYVNPTKRCDMIKMILEEKEIKNYEISMKDNNGYNHYVWLNAKIVDYGDGQPKIIGITRDVTQYIEAKAKQAESEKNYQLLFKKMMNRVMAVEPVFDENQKLQDIRFVNVNPSFEKHSNKKAEEILGKTWFEVFGFRNRCLEVYEKVFLTGLHQSYEAYYPDYNHQYYIGNAFRIDENEVGVIFDNITERVKAEEELKTVNANLEAIIESTNDPIWLLDRDFKCILCNTANRKYIKKYFNIDIIIGNRSEDIFANDYALMWNSYYERVLKEGSYSIELFSPISGAYFEFSFNPIYKDGEIIAISCFAKDITSRKLAEQQIFKLNEELEQRVIERTAELQLALTELEAFTYTVSHDLKSPLRAIEAYSRIMVEDYSEKMEDDIEGMTANINNISKDMIELINNLLQYSTTAKLDIYKETVDISEMINMIFYELVYALPERKIKLIMETELPQVKADKILLKQVIYNIISNAIKFTKTCDSAILKVGHVIVKEDVVFYLSDNGVGFDMDLSGKLFGIFQRLHSKEEYEGTGIGLAAMRKIIQKHGGRTWIEGCLNQGATVYFTIPLDEEGILI